MFGQNDAIDTTRSRAKPPPTPRLKSGADEAILDNLRTARRDFRPTYRHAPDEGGFYASVFAVIQITSFRYLGSASRLQRSRGTGFDHIGLASEAALHGCRSLLERSNLDSRPKTHIIRVETNRSAWADLRPSWTTRSVSPAAIGGICSFWCNSGGHYGSRFITQLVRPGPVFRSFIGTKC